MNRLLIISPYFPPSNAADMQRVRMSLPYFKNEGWEAEVVLVDASYSDIKKDDLLVSTIPADIKIHTVKAFNKSWTSKFGLGSLALRSLYFYRKKVDELLTAEKFDLIYFSTTQFPICVLGAYWKKKFGVPYVIDMQDPWHSEYYRDKPRHQRPRKYWFSYRLNKYLEPLALKKVDGLISVSQDYITDLKNRYPVIKNIPSAVIPFGSFAPDLDIAIKNKNRFAELLDVSTKNLVYVGRGGSDMHTAITPVLKAFKKGLDTKPQLFAQLKLYFIGTSYAPEGAGTPTILPLAKQFGLEDQVIEMTDRISYFHTLATLQQADALFMPGSDDPRYTASKIYPYLMVNKPLLTVFNSKSPAMQVLKGCGVRHAYTYDATVNLETKVLNFLCTLIDGTLEQPVYNDDRISEYSAANMTRKQCQLFDQVLTATCV